MSKPRIIAEYKFKAVQIRAWAGGVVDHWPDTHVRVEWCKGDHERALKSLRSAVAEVERQIAESHAPTWDVPRNEGEECD